MTTIEEAQELLSEHYRSEERRLTKEMASMKLLLVDVRRKERAFQRSIGPSQRRAKPRREKPAERKEHEPATVPVTSEGQGMGQ